MEDFQINEYLPLRDVVFETLRQKILKGELKPGERLIEVALAQRLGVSRTPVREAIHKLEQEGLVVMAPRKGAQVATISRAECEGCIRGSKGNGMSCCLSCHFQNHTAGAYSTASGRGSICYSKQRKRSSPDCAKGRRVS